MTGFEDPAFYGEHWVNGYDEHTRGLDTASAVNFLAGLANDGPVLELGIGTGRVALPLAARGVVVEGVDASDAMVERLRTKPGGDSIKVVIGDMADVPVSGPFRLVYLVYNSLFILLTQEQQADCFRNVARALGPGGLFVIECDLPNPALFDRDGRMQILEVTEDSASFMLSRHDRARQRVTIQFVTLDGAGMRMRPAAVRYSWPSELDLMARLAGLQLAERYADWKRRPFDSTSSGHVSVYRLR